MIGARDSRYHDAWPRAADGSPMHEFTHTDTASGDAPSDHGGALAPTAGMTVGQYELIRLLGRGGMGTVFLARDTVLARLVAIKFVTAGASDVPRFLAEARATARCHHPNIVVIHDVDAYGEWPYMVLEYLEGQTLAAWRAERERPVPPALVVELIRPVVEALACAHEMGIVHRDLKPANVVIAASGAIKVLDFGVAKVLPSPSERREATEREDSAVARPDVIRVRDARRGLDPPGALDSTQPAGASGPGSEAASRVRGTLAYMSPEQLLGEPVDGRSDLWAVGIMMWELATGAHPLAPFGWEHVSEVTAREMPMPSAREHFGEAGDGFVALADIADVIDRCLAKRPKDRFESARALLAALDATARAGADAVSGSRTDEPFLGLAAFQERDAGRFFGREREVREAIARLDDQPMLAVVGPSGAGKSSFARAGVIPALGRGGEPWDALVVRPGPRPLAALASLISDSPESPESPESPDDELRARPGLLGATLRARARATGRRVLVLVDQFEELYTLAPDRDREPFCAALAGVADDAGSPLRLLVTLRSDFLDRLGDHVGDREPRAALPALARSLMLLPPIDRAGLRDALVRPVTARGCRWESDELVDELVDALADQPGALPLLQFAAAQLWADRDRARGVLTRARFADLGGVSGTLARHADTMIGAMLPADRKLARQVFLRLVTPERTRALVSLRELRELGEAGPAARGGHADHVSRVVGQLVDARLLVAEADDDAGTVELVHESLIDRWQTLARWLDESAEDTAQLARLRNAARDWRAGGRAPGLLWRGEALLAYRAWRARYHGALTEVEAEFGDACLREERRGRRRRGIALALAFAALAGIAAVLFWQQRRAEHERARAEAQRTRAADYAAESRARMAALYQEQGRQALLAGDPARAFAYLTAARREGADSPAQRFLLGRARDLLDGELHVLAGHEGPVWAIAWSPDGRHVATGGEDGRLIVWDADTGALVRTLRREPNPVWTLAFRPNARQLISAGWEKEPVEPMAIRSGVFELWEIETGARVWRGKHDRAIFAVAFTEAGDKLVTASADSTAKIWDAETGSLLATLARHGGPVTAAVFTRDGRYVLTGSADQTVRAWDVLTGEPVATIEDLAGMIPAIALSSDRTRAVAVSIGGEVRLFSPMGGEPLALPGERRSVNGAVFSPDGTRVVTAGEDRTAQVWDARTGARRMTVEAHNGGITGVAYSPDGAVIATAGRDGTARLWDAYTGRLRWTHFGHTDGLWRVAFSSDGDRMVTAGLDGTARIWSPHPVARRPVLSALPSPVLSASFDAEEARIVATHGDKAARVWDRGGTLLAVLPVDSSRWQMSWSPDGDRLLAPAGERGVIGWDWRSRTITARLDAAVEHPRDDRPGQVLAVYAPDGQRIAMGHGDGSLSLWDAGSPTITEISRSQAHAERITWVAFSRDGRRLVTASSDTTARIWDANAAPIAAVIGHGQAINTAWFSGDGRWLVTASQDRTARVWDAATGVQLVVFDGHSDAVRDAVISPDSRLVATASDDGTIKVWDASAGTLLWSIDVHLEQVGAVGFLDGGSTLWGAYGTTVATWPIGYDDRALPALEQFARCRAGYDIGADGQLMRVPRDHDACRDIH